MPARRLAKRSSKWGNRWAPAHPAHKGLALCTTAHQKHLIISCTCISLEVPVDIQATPPGPLVGLPARATYLQGQHVGAHPVGPGPA